MIYYLIIDGDDATLSILEYIYRFHQDKGCTELFISGHMHCGIVFSSFRCLFVP